MSARRASTQPTSPSTESWSHRRAGRAARWGIADVELDVPEAVVVDHLAADLAGLDLRLAKLEHGERARLEGGADPLERHAGGEMRRGGAEHVARVERRRHRLDDHVGRGDLDRALDAARTPPRPVESKPLSGPTKTRPSPASTAMSRSLPTFGSTTASRMASAGR